MVALSGWPEPVYIDSHRVVGAGKGRSRSGTPRGSISGASGGQSGIGADGDKEKFGRLAVSGSGQGMASGDVEMTSEQPMSVATPSTSTSTRTPSVASSPYAHARIANQDLYPYYHLAVTGKPTVDLGLGRAAAVGANGQYVDIPPADVREVQANGLPIDPALMNVDEAASPADGSKLESSIKGIDTNLYPYANRPQPVSPHPCPPAHAHRMPSASGRDTPPDERQATQRQGNANARSSAFVDPRFNPRASVLDSPGGHMRLAPSWANSASASSTSTSQNQGYTSIRTSLPDPVSPPPPSGTGSMAPPPVPAGSSSTPPTLTIQRDSGLRSRLQREATGVPPRPSPLGLFSERAHAQGQIMRSTPEVYPPPRPSSAEMRGAGVAGILSGIPGLNGDQAAAHTGSGTAGWATEVYPRDPDSVLLWRQTAAAAAAGAGTGTGINSADAKKRQEGKPQSFDRLQHQHPAQTYSYHASALSPPHTGGWSPTVPWREGSGSGDEDMARQDGDAERGHGKMDAERHQHNGESDHAMAVE